MMAAAATGGELRLARTRLDLVTAVARVLDNAGVEVTRNRGRGHRASRVTASTAST